MITSLNYLLAYCGVIAAHRLMGRGPGRGERAFFVLIIFSEALIIAPLSIEYLKELRAITHRRRSCLASLVYLMTLAYMLISLILRFWRIKLTEDRILSWGYSHSSA